MAGTKRKRQCKPQIETPPIVAVFSLLSLPILAMELVLKNFQYVEIIHFSKTSKRCHRIVKSLKYPVRALRISLDKYSVSIHLAKQFVKDIYDPINDVFGYWRFRTTFGRSSAKREKYEINGTKIVIRRETDRHVDALVPEKDILKTAMFFIDFLIDFFNIRSMKLSIDLDKNETNYVFESFLMNPKIIQTFQNLSLDCSEELSDKQHYQFFSAYSKIPILIYRSDEPITYKALSYRPRIPIEPIECVKIETMSELPRLTLLSFLNCKQVKIFHSRLIEKDYIEFIKAWLDSSSDLKYFITNGLEWEQLDLSPFNPKPLDRDVNDRDFRMEENPPVMDCSNKMTITRKDGKQATVFLFQRDFYFLVWD